MEILFFLLSPHRSESLETFLGGMEISRPTSPSAPRSVLETFLGGMEIRNSDVEYDEALPSLKPSLVEWKWVGLAPNRPRFRPLKPSLVEWK